MQVVMYQNQRILSMGCKKRGSYFAHAPSFNPSTAGKASSQKHTQKNAPALGLDDTFFVLRMSWKALALSQGLWAVPSSS